MNLTGSWLFSCYQYSHSLSLSITRCAMFKIECTSFAERKIAEMKCWMLKMKKKNWMKISWHGQINVNKTKWIRTRTETKGKNIVKLLTEWKFFNRVTLRIAIDSLPVLDIFVSESCHSIMTTANQLQSMILFSTWRTKRTNNFGSTFFFRLTRNIIAENERLQNGRKI